MKLNNDMRCLIETLFNRVIDFNERMEIWKGEARINVTAKGKGIYLQFDSLTSCGHWADELGIWATTEKQLENMIQWLDENIAIVEKDEIDPKLEAQRELDKEQI